MKIRMGKAIRRGKCPLFIGMGAERMTFFYRHQTLELSAIAPDRFDIKDFLLSDCTKKARRMMLSFRPMAVVCLAEWLQKSPAP